MICKTPQAANVVLLTNKHVIFDAVFIQQHTKLIVDMRNMVKDADNRVYKL
jgi:UDP-N-acetyl-D-glucosamine dehydrogenase